MIHAFAPYDTVNGWYPEGFAPYAGLTRGNDDNLYGTTNGGGPTARGFCGYGGGTVFRITPGGDLTVLHSLVQNDGCAPNAGLSLAADGNFYGSTAFAGPSASASGTVFRMTPSGDFTVLYAFVPDPGTSTYSHGNQPVDEPLLDGAGNLYGTTSAGGPAGTGSGTVWRLSPAGEHTVLKAFSGAGSGADGSFPFAGLTLGADGNYYGTTLSGGANSIGTLFRITPDGTHEVLHSFEQSAGGSPDGRLIETSPGVFVGTTQVGGTFGGGVVFRLSLASATATTLNAFPASAVFGQALTLTATVSSAGGTPTGQVEFFDGGTSLGTASLDGGSAALTIALGVGAHTVTAMYLGEGGFTSSSSPDESVIVTQAQTTTSAVGAPNPSTRRGIVTITATVAAVAPGSGTPTGQVTFSEGRRRLGTATLVNGVATFVTSFNAGSHVVTATYVGDGNFLGSVGTMTQTVTR